MFLADRKHQTDGIDGLLIGNIEHIVLSVDQVETATHVLQAYPTLAGFLADGCLAVAADEMEVLARQTEGNLDKRLLLIAHTVLEGILDESDENHGRQLARWQLVGYVDGDGHLVRIAQLHQPDIAFQGTKIKLQGHQLLSAFVESEAHDTRQFDNSLFGFLGINIHKRMDIVERVHQEMRVDLIAQVGKLLF